MEPQADIASVQRENESLRREIAKLENLRALTYRDGLTGLAKVQAAFKAQISKTN